MPNQQTENKLNLTVKWSDREPFEEDYPVNNKVAKVRDDAGKEFGIPNADLAKYDVLLVQPDGTQKPLPIDAKLKDLDLENGACLVLQAPASPLG